MTQNTLLGDERSNQTVGVGQGMNLFFEKVFPALIAGLLALLSTLPAINTLCTGQGQNLTVFVPIGFAGIAGSVWVYRHLREKHNNTA